MHLSQAGPYCGLCDPRPQGFIHSGPREQRGLQGWNLWWLQELVSSVTFTSPSGVWTANCRRRFSSPGSTKDGGSNRLTGSAQAPGMHLLLALPSASQGTSWSVLEEASPGSGSEAVVQGREQ